MAAKSDARWARGETPTEIVTVGDPRLREPAKVVTDVAVIRALADRLVAKLRELNGAGLAANQLGEPEAIVAIEVRKTDVFPYRPESPLYVMVNPTIVEQSEQLVDEWEGCFSIPGLMGKVPRPSRVTVEYTNLDGKRIREDFEGYLARVVQHELSHLEGRDFLDYMTSMESITTVENWLQFHRQ
jgi:peptide deformylase